MRGQTKRLMIAASMMLVCGAAQATPGNGNGQGQGCSVATLSGLYAFHATGFNIVGGAALPKAILEVMEFNGDGTLTVPKATVSINGTITHSPPNGVGSYTMAADCTGTLAFGTTISPGPTFDLVLGLTDAEVFMIQTGPGAPVFQGKAERVARH